MALCVALCRPDTRVGGERRAAFRRLVSRRPSAKGAGKDAGCRVSSGRDNLKAKAEMCSSNRARSVLANRPSRSDRGLVVFAGVAFLVSFDGLWLDNRRRSRFPMIRAIRCCVGQFHRNLFANRPGSQLLFSVSLPATSEPPAPTGLGSFPFRQKPHGPFHFPPI